MIELIDTFIRPLISTGLPYAVTGSVAAILEESPDIIDQTFLQHHLTALNLTTQYQAALALTHP